MGRVIVEQIISVDGYAADADGGIDFFVNAQAINEADSEQLRLLQGVKAIVLGRVTYGMFSDYWPEADPAKEPVAVPLNTIPKYVVSNTLAQAPWGTKGDSAGVLRGDGVASLRVLRGQVAGDIIVWGSLTLADALLAAGEVDVLRLRSVPVLIGAGRSFTPAALRATALELRSLQHYPQGVVVSEYALPRDGS
ncbi:dihydrofolate reductase family protein [Pseudoxanthomonas indica]|uniref:Dihydrofolate reductase n=1 Tax=Pseudoxanthomonas indica TaxID=428993 RepID=A0A1T5JUM8_9GAMM|nr:dihydrofolate reductase family protein [Pseudoxanthomonas indica]GGD44469.1 deaminase reductase [Pseudoxanthomonas indica]SKC55055.1 Dihydrofolate reductase [Pseudoxanthomonas indica]